MQTYVGFLRGVNVGGKAMIKMTDLKQALSNSGLSDVRTYIQSGNVLFGSNQTNKHTLAEQVSGCIQIAFDLSVDVAVFTADEWHAVITDAPSWWGKGDGWKHNLLIFTKPVATADAIREIGELKPGIEHMAAGSGVLYQSLLWEAFGRTVGGKLAAKPLYKQVTIRNYNTVTKIGALLD